MTFKPFRYSWTRHPGILALIITLFFQIKCEASDQKYEPVFEYTISIPHPETHTYHVDLYCKGLNKDTAIFKLPKWTPGYYQIMNYEKAVENFTIKNNNGKPISFTSTNENTWQVLLSKVRSFHISYDIKTDRQFVANSYVDSSHAYIIPSASFLYVPEHLNYPVSVTVDPVKDWANMATGLEKVSNKSNEFKAANFDILYDSPILMGNLEELLSFMVQGIPHRFIGYKLGDFDKAAFISNLKKIVETAVGIIGDIPYKEYTFIAVGPGRGGIEHLNNTTVSFDGKELHTEDGMNRMMNFLAHEYFHHYNVKRIRPFELGPFNYDKANRTNLLWISEGLSVYYEYMIVKRAGLINEESLLDDFEKNINALENNPGRQFQSLAQASYETWSDGPFGRQGTEASKSISYYDKGPIVGLFLDFVIRNATENQKSLDDVMRYLYWHFYKELHRGFTDAEFQQACETIAGFSLNSVFEYVYTTKELDYNSYLNYAGLKVEMKDGNLGSNKSKISAVISPIDKPTELQKSILSSWINK